MPRRSHRSRRTGRYSGFLRRHTARGGGRRPASYAGRLRFETLEARLAMAGVVINEFLAINNDGITDQDGHHSDWIELKNTDSTPVSINGWYLADGVDQWQIPNITLEAGQHLVIFASNKDRAVAGQELHTNFELDGDGESLKLLMTDGTTVVHGYDPYPEQLANVSYGIASAGILTETLVDEGAPLRAFVPNAASSLDTTWYARSFDDSSWITGSSGVGFDNSASPVDFDPYIDLDLQQLMWNFSQSQRRQSAYIRLPFEIEDPSALTSLKMRIRYDDGYGLYLNGTRIPSGERAAPTTLAWNSVATSARSDDAAALVYTEIDLSAFRDLLQPGHNVLGIHGLNRSNTDPSADFLIDPLLIAERLVPTVVGYMVTPTPAAANLAGTQGHVVADTKFSVDRGFYSAPFTVSITTETPGAQIRYTLDGSVPTATTGLIYNPANPPLISTTTTLRAAAFKPGYTPTNIDTQTYIFLDDVIRQDGIGLPPYAPWGKSTSDPVPDWEMDPNIVNDPLYASTIKDDLLSVATVSLVMPWGEWFGSNGRGIYISGTSTERLGSFELFNASGTENYEIGALMEIQGGGVGGTSALRWKTDKLSIQVTFKPPAPTRLDAPLFTNPQFDQGAGERFDTLILDSVLNYSWLHRDFAAQRDNAKYIQDQVVADFQNLAGGQAPHGRYVHLYLNGLYWGMYYLHERPDERFAETYLGGDKEDYDVLKHNGTAVVHGDLTAPGNYASMLSAVRQDNNLSIPANYAAVEEWLDIDDFIDYMIVNYYAGNDDWAQKNWYASFNRVDPNGRWRFHSWDAEHAFTNVDHHVTSRINTGGPTEIHHRLMGNAAQGWIGSPEYRLRFADRVQGLMTNGGALTPVVAGAVYAARMAEAERAIVGESARWGDNRREPAYTQADWLATQNNLLNNYFPNRTGAVLNRFASLGWRVPVAAPLMSQYGGTVQPGYQLILSLPGGTRGVPIYYTLDGTDPRDPATNLPRAGAMLYTGPITINAGTEVSARIFVDGESNSVDEWSPLVQKKFFLPTPFPLRITELHYNPAAQPGVTVPEELEFIELTNTGDQFINLVGVQITQFGATPYTFSSRNLGPGERIVVAKNPAAFQSVYGTEIDIAATGYGDANLSNNGERLILLGPLGETLQDFTYDDDPPWPTSPDGGGYSLVIIDPLGDPSDPANWRASLQVGGSPGGADVARPGDYDRNGVVEDTDWLTWRTSFSSNVPAGMGADGNGDGVVDAADYVVWRKYRSSQLASAATTAFVAATPPLSLFDAPAQSSVIAATAVVEPVVLDAASNRIAATPRPFARPLMREAFPVGTTARAAIDLNLLDALYEGVERDANSANGSSPLEAFGTAGSSHASSAMRNELPALFDDDSWLDSLCLPLV
jgi:hypothetical protein